MLAITSLVEFCPFVDETPVCTVIPETTFFKLLVEQWLVERGATSSITEMACRSYLRIIGMGRSAIPLILRQMNQEGDEPDMWFVALQMLITGEDPVTDEIRWDFFSRQWRIAGWNGRQTSVMPGSWPPQDFPALADYEWVAPPSPATGCYNCIAWSVGRSDRKW